jgi:pilus assembly protein Flp/PilA
MKDSINAILMRVLMRARGEEGQAAVEYGVLVALIIAISVAIIKTLGGDVSSAFQSVVTAL